MKSNNTYQVSSDLLSFYLPSDSEDCNFTFTKLDGMIYITALKLLGDDTLHTDHRQFPTHWEDYDQLQDNLNQLSVWGESHIERTNA